MRWDVREVFRVVTLSKRLKTSFYLYVDFAAFNSYSPREGPASVAGALNKTQTKNAFLVTCGKPFLLIRGQTCGSKLQAGWNVGVILIDELEKNVHRNTGCVPRGSFYIMVLERRRCPCFESRVKASYELTMMSLQIRW